ncbi:MAG: hypothetical protein IKX22_07645 [Prevotella sp.]|nr:hypothetical protein [Prevotella sp.]
MAFFIVIGTNNDVKGVVDEVKKSHLQQDVITSGCIISEEDGLYYQWDVFNEKGNKTQESKGSVVLQDALTNQISQFKTLLPDNAIPNVFIVSKCFDEEECNTLQMVYEELCQIGGAKLSGLLIDIVLIGYDINKPEDVTIRPHWRLLESIRGLGEGCLFHTNILYVNNMDYMGAATNVDSRVFSKFLCHWSKMVCSGGYDPRATVKSNVYSIGMSEHQYDFRDLDEFFKLSAEERLLDRTLNDSPSLDTQELLDTNYFKKIDLDLPWLDGLCIIQSIWNTYCTMQWNPSKLLRNNGYSVSQQELIIASYLNLFLKLYISEEEREIDILNAEISQKEVDKTECSENLKKITERTEEDEAKSAQIDDLNKRIAQLDSEIEACKIQILRHKRNILNNTFLDADEFHERFGTMDLLTEDDEHAYETNKADVERLTDYVKSEAGIKVMREAVERATTQDILPGPPPKSEVLNMGRVKAIVIEETSSNLQPLANTPSPENQSERSGCLFWFKSLFNRNKLVEGEMETAPLEATQFVNPERITKEERKSLNDTLGKSVVAIKKADDVRSWWKRLCEIIERNQKRLAECKLLMDGERDVNGEYVPGKEGYLPEQHRKSTSLIDMDRVRNFRDSDVHYKQNIAEFLDRWFDKTIELDKRITMLELIKHQVLDPLEGKFHTLHWDGSNPFVKEEIADEEIHEYIEHDLKQSKPFVEYVRIEETNLVTNLSVGFFSNNQNIPTDYTEFKNRYKISSESLIPVYLRDFVNSLCVIQIMDIPDHVDALKDFKPRREASLSRLNTDIRAEATTIIGEANTVEEKARTIYNWICDNIAYDTTKQIHDAETCYKTRRGVCQAYCELFCYMVEAVGLTADIITGITKNNDGNISSDKHSWVFVYIRGYEGILIDPTWGAGAVDGVKFVKSEDYSAWFNVSPYWMIFSHFPDQQYWSKLDINITEEQFEKLPIVEMNNETDGKDYLFECLCGQH